MTSQGYDEAINPKQKKIHHTIKFSVLLKMYKLINENAIKLLLAFLILFYKKKSIRKLFLFFT